MPELHSSGLDRCPRSGELRVEGRRAALFGQGLALHRGRRTSFLPRVQMRDAS